jgi:hypothetical protein
MIAETSAVPSSRHRSAAGLGLLVCALIPLLFPGQSAAQSAAATVAACPNWIGADESAAYWLSQFDDGSLHKQPADGPPVLLGRGCTRMAEGTVRMDREAIYCTDGNWQNILRMEKTSGGQTLLRVGKPLRGTIKLVADSVVFGFAEGNDWNRLAVLPKAGGVPRIVASVAGSILAFDADSQGVVWLDQAGSVWTAPMGTGASGRPSPPPRKLNDARVCAQGARVPTECGLAIDGDFVFLSVQPRCAGNEPCPKPTARIERMGRGGGGWVSVAFSQNTIRGLQIDGDTVTWADCIAGTVARMPRRGGTIRALQAPGACWAYAVGEKELLWFNAGKKLDWSDCTLQRARK